jgi:hypothetical protein
MPKELLTLQFGGYSNYVGAHFWNAQDELLSEAYSTAGGAGAGELDAGVLYQQGEAATGRGGGGGGGVLGRGCRRGGAGPRRRLARR